MTQRLRRRRAAYLQRVDELLVHEIHEGSALWVAEQDSPWNAATVVAEYVEAARVANEATRTDRREPRRRCADDVDELVDADRRPGARIDVASTGAT